MGGRIFAYWPKLRTHPVDFNLKYYNKCFCQFKAFHNEQKSTKLTLNSIKKYYRMYHTYQ